MSATSTIPPNHRHPKLKDMVFKYAAQLATIRREHPGLFVLDRNWFLYFSLPWIIEPNTPEQTVLFEQRRREFEEAGFTGMILRQELLDVLRGDVHLAECCPHIAQLARFLDVYIVMGMVEALLQGAQKDELERRFSEFLTVAYEQRFQTIALSHLFNFDAEGNNLLLGTVRIEKLDNSTISSILGETTPSFLHPPKTGEFFVVAQDTGRCDDVVSWLQKKADIASSFLQVLQYFKDGVVHIDYSMPYFLPHWVNEIRKWGIFFTGQPRRVSFEGGKRFYRLYKYEQPEVERWWLTYQLDSVIEKMNDERNKMRQVGLRAGEYFELSHTQSKPTDRLVNLAIALESLFAPDDKSEFTFRIAQSAAQLVGSSPETRLTIQKEIKAMYQRRSQLFHGHYDVEKYYDGRFVTHEDCDRWSSIIRQAVLRFFVLYLGGRNDPKAVREMISNSALDPLLADSLRTESEVSLFLERNSTAEL